MYYLIVLFLTIGQLITFFIFNAKFQIQHSFKVNHNYTRIQDQVEQLMEYHKKEPLRIYYKNSVRTIFNHNLFLYPFTMKRQLEQCTRYLYSGKEYISMIKQFIPIYDYDIIQIQIPLYKMIIVYNKDHDVKYDLQVKPKSYLFMWYGSGFPSYHLNVIKLCVYNHTRFYNSFVA